MKLEERLRARLEMGKTATGKLPGAAPKALLGEAAQRLGERVAKESYSPLAVYFVFDTTMSMSPYIDAVKDCAEQVGSSILSTEKGIEACVMGVAEHEESPAVDWEQKKRSRVFGEGTMPLGDYGQDNQIVSDNRIFASQARELLQNFGNIDCAEAYECLAAYLATKINEDKTKNPQKKYAVIFFGDSFPHGSGVKSDQKRGNPDDLGCPHHKGPEQLTILASIADRSYWVDCNEDSKDFLRGTFEAVKGISTATYVKFTNAQSVLPEALIGMVKQAQSPAALAEYLKALPTAKASTVAGLLGAGTSGKLYKP